MSKFIKLCIYVFASIIIFANTIVLFNPIMNFTYGLHLRFSTEFIVIHTSIILIGLILCLITDEL